MKKVSLTVLFFFSLFTNIIFSQSPAINIPMTVSDLAGGHSKVVYFGLDPTATDGLDASLGEVAMPPLPPANAFDARFNLITTESSMKDYRAGTSTFTGQVTHEIQYQVGLGGTQINLSWVLPTGVTGVLKDVILGTLINVSMSGTGNYTVTNPGVFNKLNMVIDYDLFTATPPYFQNFDGVVAPILPTGWKVSDNNSDTKLWTNTESNPRSSPNAMAIIPNSSLAMDDWFFSPGINLTQGIGYQVIFWYKVGNAATPEKLEVKYGLAKDAAGMTSEAIFSNTNVINTAYSKGVGIITPSLSGLYYIGWHGLSNQNMGNIYIDDISIRVQPSASNTQTIAIGSTAATEFTGTGATVQFTIGNSGELDLTFDKILSIPGGSLPGAIVNCAGQYWSAGISSGVVDGTYSITLDLTGIQGINNCATLHLLKRDNASGAWVDLGVPSSCSAFPFVTWSGLTSFSEFGIGGLSNNPLPVELTAFTAFVNGRDVFLNWATKTEVNSNKFIVEKIVNNEWIAIGEIKASGNSNSLKEYSFTDKNLISGNYGYRLKMIDNDGMYKYGNIIKAEIAVPNEFKLFQNYPNPFNPITVISYQLSGNSKVSLKLFDVLGNEVAVLVDGEQDAGYYNFELGSVTFNLTSGVYFYRLQAGEFIAVKKLVLMK